MLSLGLITCPAGVWGNELSSRFGDSKAPVSWEWGRARALDGPRRPGNEAPAWPGHMAVG